MIRWKCFLHAGISSYNGICEFGYTDMGLREGFKQHYKQFFLNAVLSAVL